MKLNILTNIYPYRIYHCNTIIGIIARWAISQSPYTLPRNLEKALNRIRVILREHPTFVIDRYDQWIQLHPERLYSFIENIIFNTSEIISWNSNQSTLAGDYIDLYALTRNVVESLRDYYHEYYEEKGFSF